jgi:YbbR domain-containing protein
MIRRIADTIFRATLALLLAVLVWIVASQEKDPTQVATFPSAIPLTRVNQPPDTLVYGQTADSVRVTLRAPESLWTQLTADQIKAEIDLAGQPYGHLTALVQVHVTNRVIQVVRVEPATVDLDFEPITEQSVPVHITKTGDPALGYAADVPSATPAQVVVRGPASFVAKVATVSGSISVQSARQKVEQSVRLDALDKNGAPVGYVTLSPESVQASVDVRHLGGFRDLAVKVIVRGQVASGYRISNVTVDPPIVTVFGSSQAIDQSPGYLETEPISVTNAQDDIIERVPLNLPGGISMLGDPAVQVHVQVEAIQGGLTVQRPLTVQGLAHGLEAKLSPDTIDVILTGPLPKLQALKPDDVRVVIDLGNLGSGTHQIKPQTIVPQGIVAETMLPATIQVTIGPVGTLNLSPIATPTITPTRPKTAPTAPGLTPTPAK